MCSKIYYLSVNKNLLIFYVYNNTDEMADNLKLTPLLLGGLVIFVILLLIGYNGSIDHFGVFEVRLERQEVPDIRAIDKITGNNNLMFSGNPPKPMSNTDYQESMCLNRRTYSKSQMCNSIVGVVPYPQSTNNPENFIYY
jgi:hypothetical protein